MNTQNQNAILRIILLILLMLLQVSCSSGKQKENQFSFIKAAHYFSDVWPKTFWQEFELDKVESDLEQIKQDGFNTIVLVVPWRGFELGFNDKKTQSNEAMYQRFEFLLDKITAKKLDFILRIGFPHNFDPKLKTVTSQNCSNIYTQEKTQDQWQSFLNKIQNKVEKYKPYLSGVLISWEDFWCPHFIFPKLDSEARVELAQTTGYASWLLKKDLATVKVLLGQNEIRQNEISIPTKQAGDYLYYIKFIDEKFNELILQPAKNIFPTASMEIRIDKDPSKAFNGENIWISHDLHFDDKNHRGTYWAPFWGADNNGETLTLEQALFNFEYFLNYVTNQGQSTNHVIEQFNFTDNTPYFPNNAVLAEDKVDDFLLASVPLLKKYSAGYGVWAYKDYADNGLYNSSFELGLDGWDIVGTAKIITDKQDKQLKLLSNSSITQSFNPAQRYMLARSYKKLNLCMDSLQTGDISIYANQVFQRTINLQEGNNCYQISATSFINEVKLEFKIQANSSVVIDEIKLYGFVQKLGIYDEFGKPSKYLEAIRTINKQLD